jgi:tetratricopeptide (TPR) repeat protein
MTTAFDIQRHVSRFKRTAQVDDVWEGAIERIPSWVDGGPNGDPYRPLAAVLVSTTRRLGHLKLWESEGDSEPSSEALLLEALGEMATSSKLAGYRPCALRVGDPALAAALRDALAGTGTSVDLVEDLPVVSEFFDELAAETAADDVPAALSAPGVTPDRLRAFAEAAKAFFEAAPWRHLDDGDLLEVEQPKAGRGLTLFAVMGSAGQQFGLGFFSSAAKYRALLDGATPEEFVKDGSEWVVYFSPGWETPLADVIAWDRLQLPLASAHAYPAAMRLHLDGAAQRPDASRLAYLEGLLHVLAETTEAEMDTGRWTRTVPTADGQQTYVLTLPDLLEPAAPPARMDPRSMERIGAEIERLFRDRQFESIEEANAVLQKELAGSTIDDVPSTATTPLEKAQELIYQAYDATGRRQLQLIRRALALSPDCADAYILLAERAPSRFAARPSYEQALAAGERALGPGAFEDPDRSFWGDVSTRPYMRARVGLAECLAAEDDFDGAVDHYRALLRLNPDDNQGVRYLLLTTLLRAGRNAEADALLKESDEPTALWTYAAVLLALRAKDYGLARKRLRAALKANRRVPRYLTGGRELPSSLPSHYAVGSDDEAVVCAYDLILPWEDTPEAAAWLRTETRKNRK